MSPLISISVRDIYCDHLSDAAPAHWGGRRRVDRGSLSVSCPVPSIPLRSDRRWQQQEEEEGGGAARTEEVYFFPPYAARTTSFGEDESMTKVRRLFGGGF